MASAERRPHAAVRAVFFDLGDTVWHFPDRPPPEAIAAELARRVEALLREWGQDGRVEAAALQQEITRGWGAAERASAESGGVGPDYAGMLRSVALGHGLDLTPEQIARLWEVQNAGGRFLGRVVLPDAVETLSELRARGFRLGVITNRGHGGEGFIEELRDYGLAEHFEAVVSSDQVGHRKPHPRIFEVALERLGVRSAEAVHVGDRVDADLVGARGAGMRAIWMRGVVSPDQELPEAREIADYVVSRLSDLLLLPILQRP